MTGGQKAFQHRTKSVFASSCLWGSPTVFKAVGFSYRQLHKSFRNPWLDHETYSTGLHAFKCAQSGGNLDESDDLNPVRSHSLVEITVVRHLTTKKYNHLFNFLTRQKAPYQVLKQY